ncbi:MAG: dehypoxanthine futalosine cyclase [Deltaproteobacteria bacterium]|nr:MAG: dehypoxanthine futalosine cyclase [Deltaproteobacteria bacterium]
MSRIDRAEALTLFREAPLLELARRADNIRKELHPEGRVTFVVDRNINYSNICTCQCRFCAFYRAPGDPEGYLLTREEIFGKIQELVDLGGTQLLMQGGLHPDLEISWFEDLFAAIKKSFPEVTIHSLSPAEVVNIAKVSGLTMEDALRRLKEGGLDSIPGGGAEVLVDSIRKEISPNKIGWRKWAEVMLAAAKLGMGTTATMMFGSSERDEDIVEHLFRIREIQEEGGSFTAFIPWSFQPSYTELGEDLGEGPASAIRYLRVLSLARIVIDNVPNIQASWVTQGEKIAQVALKFGANDLGSTMLEENVVAAAGVSFRLDKERLIKLIADAGFVAAQRRTDYKIIREFQ